jgi:hypothetical protein
MTYNSLEELFRNKDVEHELHTSDGPSMNSLFIEKSSPNFVLTQSTMLGQDNRGQVARIFDYYESDEIGPAMKQMQAFSNQFGIPMVSVKFVRKTSFDKDAVMRQMLLNTYSTTAAVHT